MRYLLDTCTFLWVCIDSPKLSESVREIIRNATNEIWLSSVSAWEIATKHSLDRLPLPVPPMEFVSSRREKYLIGTLPLTEEEALHSVSLPKLHSDPFDRLLIAQALLNGATILTPDKAIKDYGIRVIW